MDWFERCRQTKLDNLNSRSSVSICRDIHRTRPLYSDHRGSRHRGYFSNRYCLYLSAVSFFFFTSIAKAGDVGGVSATASPNASSTGSVINQGIQVLQGPYITNTYGNNIQCQGPTLNFTPFVTGALSRKTPFESHYLDPVYDTSDVNEDGLLDNPGDVLYWKDIRTGQKDSNSWTGGLSATLSIPLDRGLQRRCKEAADVQISLQRQLVANKRLDYELARLKNCGELRKKNITFHPRSPYFSICADVVTGPIPEIIPKHKHSISVDPSEPLLAPLQKGSFVSSPEE